MGVHHGAGHRDQCEQHSQACSYVQTQTTLYNTGKAAISTLRPLTSCVNAGRALQVVNLT